LSTVARPCALRLGQFAFRQTFGFDAAGIVSHAVFRPYAPTFDFDGMPLFLER
jgi:hypothetical protein